MSKKFHVDDLLDATITVEETGADTYSILVNENELVRISVYDKKGKAQAFLYDQMHPTPAAQVDFDARALVKEEW